MVELVAAARMRWQRIAFVEADFAAYLAARLPDGDPVAAAAVLLPRAGDLLLAFACARGDPAALSAFDAEYLSDCAVHLLRIDPSPAFADEVAQIIREKLFVGEAPRIVEYAGRGSLSGWVRVALMRTALNLRRARTVVLSPHGRDLEIAASGDATLELAKATHRAPFESAVRTAVARLDPRQRTVLRLHYVDGLGIDKICVLYNVGRSTIARWLVDTRERLRAEIRAELHRSLGVTGRECESLAAALYSQLTLSLGSLLGNERA
jgi:RNA polymerase sigma-70 factor, ECF subfamily